MVDMRADSRLRLLAAGLADKGSLVTIETLRAAAFSEIDNGHDEKPVLVRIRDQFFRYGWFVEPQDFQLWAKLVEVWCANPRYHTYFEHGVISNRTDVPQSLARLCRAVLMVEFSEGGFYYGPLVKGFSLFGEGVGYACINHEVAQLLDRQCFDIFTDLEAVEYLHEVWPSPSEIRPRGA